jgi:ADP-ribose pyrophosphatase
MLHQQARAAFRFYPARLPVPDAAVPWSVPWSGYAPPDFTAPHVLQNDRTVLAGGWADPVDPHSISAAEWATRVSHEGPIKFVGGVPQNPFGRTGLNGRGSLGKWGPNQAADPIVTRHHPKSGQPQVVAIVRRDTGAWALPGGMVDAGEQVSATVRREFVEEALNIPDPDERSLATSLVDGLFAGTDEKLVYKGYVDDIRNTDNSWMETCAYHFHCEGAAARLSLAHGDDAARACWIDISSEAAEFAAMVPSHRAWVESVAEKLRQRDLMANMRGAGGGR